MRFTNGCSHGTLSPCGWPTSPTPRQSEGGYRRKKSMRFTNGCSHGTLSPCGWPTSSTPRAERGRLQQNLPFNFVTKYFVDKSRQGFCSELREAPARWFEIGQS